jgi:predicted FMN-binding regulatory protein PaiB
LKGLVAFTIHVEKIEAVNKLSQGRDPDSYQNIINELSQSDDENAKRIAHEMDKKRK